MLRTITGVFQPSAGVDGPGSGGPSTWLPTRPPTGAAAPSTAANTPLPLEPTISTSQAPTYLKKAMLTARPPTTVQTAATHIKEQQGGLTCRPCGCTGRWHPRQPGGRPSCQRWPSPSCAATRPPPWHCCCRLPAPARTSIVLRGGHKRQQPLAKHRVCGGQSSSNCVPSPGKACDGWVQHCTLQRMLLTILENICGRCTDAGCHGIPACRIADHWEAGSSVSVCFASLFVPPPSGHDAKVDQGGARCTGGTFLQSIMPAPDSRRRACTDLGSTCAAA